MSGAPLASAAAPAVLTLRYWRLLACSCYAPAQGVSFRRYAQRLDNLPRPARGGLLRTARATLRVPVLADTHALLWYLFDTDTRDGKIRASTVHTIGA